VLVNNHWFNPEKNTMRQFIFVVVMVLSAGFPLCPGRAAAQEPVETAKFPEPLKWNLERLGKDPFKLVKSNPDPERAQVRFVLEFTRSPSPNEVYDWGRGDGPIVFRFLDEDGIVIKTVKSKLDGEINPKKGSRIRIILTLPDEKTLRLARSVEAD
jgi:hypothetical protein